MGGKISVTSTEGVGSTFRVALPFAVHTRPHEGEAQPDSDSPPSAVSEDAASAQSSDALAAADADAASVGKALTPSSSAESLAPSPLARAKVFVALGGGSGVTSTSCLPSLAVEALREDAAKAAPPGSPLDPTVVHISLRNPRLILPPGEASSSGIRGMGPRRTSATCSLGSHMEQVERLIQSGRSQSMELPRAVDLASVVAAAGFGREQGSEAAFMNALAEGILNRVAEELPQEQQPGGGGSSGASVSSQAVVVVTECALVPLLARKLRSRREFAATALAAALAAAAGSAGACASPLDPTAERLAQARFAFVPVGSLRARQLTRADMPSEVDAEAFEARGLLHPAVAYTP